MSLGIQFAKRAELIAALKAAYKEVGKDFKIHSTYPDNLRSEPIVVRSIDPNILVLGAISISSVTGISLQWIVSAILIVPMLTWVGSEWWDRFKNKKRSNASTDSGRLPAPESLNVEEIDGPSKNAPAAKPVEIQSPRRWSEAA